MSKRKSTGRPSKPQEKTLRRYFATLKKQGLISSKQSPSKVKLTNSLKEKLLAYEDVARGEKVVIDIKRTSVASKKETTAAFRSIGFEVHGDKAIVTPEPGERISQVGGFVIRKKKLGNATVNFLTVPVKPHDLESFLEPIGKSAELKKILPANASWSFRFFGNKAAVITRFGNSRLLIEHLMQYQSIQNAIEKGRIKDQQEIIEAIEIFWLDRSQAWEDVATESHPRKPLTQRQKQRRRQRQKKYKERMKVRNPKRYEMRLEQDAMRKRKYRAKLRRNKKAHEAYKAKERARWESRKHKARRK